MGTADDRYERRVALLFSDIEGSTRLARQLGGVWAETLGRHRDVLRSAFASQGGEEVGREGDSFFVMFSSCRAAVEAAIDAHRGLARAAWPPGGEIRVRIGVHVGAISLFDSDPVGVDIHEAARIMSAAHGGQTLVSDDVASEIADGLPEGVSVRELGYYRFKDFDNPRRVLQVEHPQLPTDFPPLRAGRAENHNLPGAVSSFVGRQAELVELTDAVAAHRVVTVVGAGAAGRPDWPSRPGSPSSTGSQTECGSSSSGR